MARPAHSGQEQYLPLWLVRASSRSHASEESPQIMARRRGRRTRLQPALYRSLHSPSTPTRDERDGSSRSDAMQHRGSTQEDTDTAIAGTLEDAKPPLTPY